MQQDDSESSHRIVLVIHAALAAGVFAMGLVVWLQQPVGDSDSLSPVGWMAIGLAAVAGAASTLAPRLLVANQLNQLSRLKGGADDDRSRLRALYQTKSILGAAILEAAAFVNVGAWLIDGNIANLAVGAALGAGILLRIPTRAAYDRWLDQQEQELLQQRMWDD